MKQIIVVTHAQAQHHLDRIVGGWHNSNLSQTGKEQSLMIATRLRNDFPMSNPKIYCSDLNRTIETALPIAKEFDSSILELSGLREMSYGEAEGKDQSWLDKRFVPPPAIGDRMNHVVCDGAESRLDLAKRIYKTMDKIYAEMQTSSIVVSHGFAHTFIVSWWIGLPAPHADYVHFASSAGSITHLLEDDTFHNRSVKLINDTTHLT